MHDWPAGDVHDARSVWYAHVRVVLCCIVLAAVHVVSVLQAAHRPDE